MPCARAIALISALSSRRRGRLGELDVVGDHPRPGLAQAVDHLTVQAAGKRPLDAELVEGAVVDRDHGEVVWRALRPADLEAGVESAQLLRLQEIGAIGEERGEDGHQRDRHQGQGAATAQPACSHRRGRYIAPRPFGMPSGALK